MDTRPFSILFQSNDPFRDSTVLVFNCQKVCPSYIFSIENQCSEDNSKSFVPSCWISRAQKAKDTRNRKLSSWERVKDIPFPDDLQYLLVPESMGEATQVKEDERSPEPEEYNQDVKLNLSRLHTSETLETSSRKENDQHIKRLKRLRLHKYSRYD